ncbi:hypothetical protein OSB04_000613 [Centaurea solstitialis]|uniref:Reverse transcriptase domain-containing protein n=1 Tax=Centaurea solstitialis TaxID=347529 RepID=A0AA38WKP6_9ASTR|nr:hypothetical protein OSB04_000613 [Centaurea solstitialis]
MRSGLRQRDPLAPFLFLIVAETEEKSLFEGIPIGQRELTTLHLYPDNVIFFGKWSRMNIKNLLKIFNHFPDISSLKINLNKNKFFGVGIGESEVQEWAREMGCEWGHTSFQLSQVIDWCFNAQVDFLETGHRKGEVIINMLIGSHAYPAIHGSTFISNSGRPKATQYGCLLYRSHFLKCRVDCKACDSNVSRFKSRQWQWRR